MINKSLKKYLYIFENLNLANINKLKALIDKNVYFEDPFNKVYGDKKFIKIFKKSLLNIENINFKILNVTSDKDVFLVKWEMNFSAFNKQNKIIGVSEIIINKEQKIISHIDYWDSFSSFYLKIPIIGKVMLLIFKIVKSKF